MEDLLLRGVVTAPENIANGIKYYNYFQNALETIGNNQIVPSVVAQGAFW